MKSIKPGRGPSMLGAIAGIAIAVFGVLWTIGAADMTSEMGGSMYAGSMDMGGIGSVFPLFGVVFVILAIVFAVYNFRNATGKKRYSEYDIVDEGEEADPLNERFGENDMDEEEERVSFCPYCGNSVDGDYEYCDRCGKKLPV